MSEKIRVIVAGATGWAGSALCKGISETEDIEIVAAVSRSNAGKNLKEILRLNSNDIPVFATAKEALEIDTDIFIEYTSPDIAKNNVIEALNKNVNVLIGTSGLSDLDYQEIEKVTLEKNCSVLAVGNFAVT